MATNSRRSISVQNKKNTNDHQLDLYVSRSDGDWTQAIHHDLNIKRRTCNTFIPKPPTTIDPGRGRSDIRCGCSRLHREHSWDVIDGEEREWDQEKHTIPAYNNAFGYIPHTRAHYIRCDIKTNPILLAELMLKVWKVKPPSLIMCIIGGAKYFKLSERLEREFIKGIIQAALKADAWIVTTGFKTGVVQLVGEAIYDHKVTNPRSHITAIGCSKWGAAKNRQALISTKPSTNVNLDASMNVTKQEKGQQDLEPNHTHFLLLDDGTYYRYETGDYRTRFVEEVSRFENKDVPIVTIVVEGGPDTLLTIYNDLRKNIPVVLVDGSGRVPNLLANFLTRTESMINRSGKAEEATKWKQAVDIIDINDIEKLKTKFGPYEIEIRDGLRDISRGSKTSEKEMDKLFNQFLYCLQPAVRLKIQIYSLDSDHALDDTIFKAIIQAKQESNARMNRAQLLRIALAWNAIEVAKEHIIKDDLNDLKPAIREELFIEALILDRPQFVNTFIKLKFDLPNMFYKRQTNKPWKLKWEQLQRLYTSDHEQNKHLSLLRKCHRAPINSKLELDRVLRKLIGDYMKTIYTGSQPGPLGQLKICCQCPQAARVSDSRTILFRNDGDDNESEVPDPEEAANEVRELVYRDLFFWSILTNRIEMAKVIVSHMQTRICATLIASKVCKSYAKFTLDNESKDDLSAQADQFEKYASDLLKCCYNYDEEKACEIAIRHISLFGGVSCLQVAVDADDKSFVGQPCCDQLLTNIWYDKMEPAQSGMSDYVRSFLSICTFGLLAPYLLTFRQEQLEPDYLDNDQKKTYEMTVNEIEEEKKELLSRRSGRLNTNGINYSETYVSRPNCCPNGCVLYFRRLQQFHESPLVKFLYTSVSYICFLLLFSYYLLFNFNPPTNQIPSIHWTEILVIIIITTMLIEDIRQFLCQDNRSMAGKFSNYFITNRFFNIIRVTSYILFYVGLILRFTNVSTKEDLSAAKIILAYDLEIWFIRSLAFLGIAQKMGPKLVMIRRMTIDLFFFIYIILIAMIAYGVASRTMYDYNSDPNADDLTFNGRSIFRHIIFPIYYLMYGSTDKELTALDLNPESATAIATQILLAFHMLFVNILLINLLIAMFSFTFDSVQSQTDLVWRYERYTLIQEYFDRPPLFPPFIIITHFIQLIRFIIRSCRHRRRTHIRTNQAKAFKMIGAHRDIDKDWSEFESYATNVYARTIIAGQPSSVSGLVSSSARQEVLQPGLDMTSQLQPNFDVKAITDEMTSIKRAVGDLRTYAEEMNRCMQWMMDAMERVKMSREPRPRLRSALTTNDLRLTEE